MPPSRLNPAVPRDLETICLKCLHKEPPQALRQRRRAGGRPAPVPSGRADRGAPAGPLERLARWARRHPAAAALLAIALLGATTLLGRRRAG